MKNITQKFFFSLFFFSFLSVAFAQDDFLDENFDEGSFPPYGWLTFDEDKDGSTWDQSSNSDGNNFTTAAISYSWYYSKYYPDNWLVTPKLKVEQATDSIKYWVQSFDSAPEQLKIMVSKTTTEVDQFTELDSFIYPSENNEGIQKAHSLKDFVGEEIYIAFVHKDHKDRTDANLALKIDDVKGPKIVPITKDLKLLSVEEPDDLVCVIEDGKPVVKIVNVGTEPVKDFRVTAIMAGFRSKDTVFSNYIYDDISATIQPKDTLTHTFSEVLPYGSSREPYLAVITRAQVVFKDDQYSLNDDLQKLTNLQQPVDLPLYVSFESSDGNSDYGGWHFANQMSEQGWEATYNTEIANSGDGFAVAYQANVGGDGRKDLMATRCLLLEKGVKYDASILYKFRTGKKAKLKFALSKDQHDIDSYDDLIIIDEQITALDDPNLTSQPYRSFTTGSFEVEETGYYFLGMFAYLETPIQSVETDKLIIDFDDFVFKTSDTPNKPDLSVTGIEVPFGCKLSSQEKVTAYFNNPSLVDVDNYKVSFKINGGNWHTEEINEPLKAGGYLKYEFKDGFADMSSTGEHNFIVKIEADGDSSPTNNNSSKKTSNKALVTLPFDDNFDYPSDWEPAFNKNWFVIKGGTSTWAAAEFYGEEDADDNTANSGKGYMADFNTYDADSSSDWLLSSCIEMNAGEEYEISFAHRIETASTNPGILKVKMISKFDTQNVIEVLFDSNSINNTSYKLEKIKFTPENDGVYSLAFESLSKGGSVNLFLDDVYIKPERVASVNDPYISNNVKVFPNPSSSKVFIEAKDFDLKKVLVYNTLGAVVNEVKNVNNKSVATVDMNLLPTGLYMFVVTTDKGTGVKKVFKN